MSKEWPPEYDRSYIPSPESRYWNEELETMDPDERELKIILPKGITEPLFLPLYKIFL